MYVCAYKSTRQGVVVIGALLVSVARSEPLYVERPSFRDAVERAATVMIHEPAAQQPEAASVLMIV
jgi:hypothetical protein